MSRTRKQLLSVLALGVGIVVTLILAGPAMQRAFFYPKPRGLPPVVSQTTEQLLARLQSVLETNAPVVSRALQPGLSDSEIATLEARGGFRLSDDLRALYRWRNGIGTNTTVGLLAGQRFVPLDEFVRAQALIAQQVASATKKQRAALTVFAGHRKGWVHVLDDGAGDGYFYDPKRTDAEGAFCYHFAESGYFVWFPSVRNFLAGVIECYESRAVWVAADGKGLDANFDRAQKIWERFGKSSESGN
jgi:cell wall assembly regulator SMI1